jgi:glycosyltransferase involved in cell wall biosynthesis
MWLLNHSSARKFEIATLKKLGFTEIFLPKNFPADIDFRSASVDASEDVSLSIPASDLALLNQTDWYAEPSRDAWDAANRHFDLIFFIMRPQFLRSLARHFRGAAILRAYGLSAATTYTATMNLITGGLRSLEDMGPRFWFGAAYDGLAQAESPWFRKREVYLPIGLHDCRLEDNWTGTDPSIFFVCPDIKGNYYYARVYREFQERFAGLRYAIGGTQALATNDPHVLGYVPEEQHHRNMREFRVMFYHSTEPNHVHYHPFEAVRAGMPLVFMAGGMLDRLGGSELPGRCRSYSEARAKLQRILAGDRNLIDMIRASQPVLLKQMCPDVLEPAWREGLTRVLAELNRSRVSRPKSTRRPRIAVILPTTYRGGTLRSAKLLAEAVWIGSRQYHEDADVILARAASELATDREEPQEWDAGLPSSISRRAIEWQVLESESARRAMFYAGHSEWIPTAQRYLAPDDRIQNLSDCDLWIIVSDRLKLPLLPIRPYLMMVYDYVQRYQTQFRPGFDATFIAAARAADRVLVTTRFTEQDALAYAGVSREKVCLVPMLAPQFEPSQDEISDGTGSNPYFLWTTNLGAHKNHYNAMRALRDYYEQFDGRLDCCVTGVESSSLLMGDRPHLEPVKALFSQNVKLSQRLRVFGELPDALYRRQLAGASFLWHPAHIDNGTLAAVEAASMGVPCLSSRYPAMEEMDAHFDLHLSWMESRLPHDMAGRLKWMEQHAGRVRATLPSGADLARHSVERHAAGYWRLIRECL